MLVYFIQYLILYKKQGNVKKRKVKRQKYYLLILYNLWTQPTQYTLLFSYKVYTCRT